jgi:hypothetical protein
MKKILVLFFLLGCNGLPTSSDPIDPVVEAEFFDRSKENRGRVHGPGLYDRSRRLLIYPDGRSSNVRRDPRGRLLFLEPSERTDNRL